MATSPAAELTALYDALARYQWWQRRCRRAPPGEALEMHKALGEDPGQGGPPAGSQHLHGWLWEQVGAPAEAHVLDVGCGFGATLLHWVRGAPGATGVGITGSPYQVRKAREMARVMGQAKRLDFVCQQFDVAWPASGTGWRQRPFDLVCAVEALGHSADLPALLRRMAGSLRPGGKIVLLEDMGRTNGDSRSSALNTIRQQLQRRWSLTHIASRADYVAGLELAGCVVVAERDLTAQVRTGDEVRLHRREQRLRRVQRLAPVKTLRRVLDAFLGGIDLERLYAAGAMEYRLVVAERSSS